MQMLPVIAEEIPNLCTRLTVPIKGLFAENHWRVRREIVTSMPAVIKHMGPEFFFDHYLTLFLPTLKDGVSEVRYAACISLKPILAAAGNEWFFQHIFPTVKSLMAEEYLIRLTAVTGLGGILACQLPEQLQLDVLGLLLSAAKDAVPNIRLRAAQVLGACCSSLSRDLIQVQVRPALHELQSDKDADVKFFASASLLSCA